MIITNMLIDRLHVLSGVNHVTLHEKLTLSTFKFSLKTFFKHLYTPLRLPLSIS